MDYEKEETIQTYNGWEEFNGIDVGDKLDFFSRNERLFDVIFAQQFDRAFLDYMSNLANQIRILAQTKMGSQKLSRLLSHKRAMLYFVQPSTRTFISFLNACHILGMRVSEIRGTSTTRRLKENLRKIPFEHLPAMWI
jgi:aspartate carbamoyltransferase catalytic subunit